MWVEFMTLFQINPGKYRHPIIIQKNEKVKKTNGERVTNWVDYFKTRASISPISGKEFFTAETMNNEITHKVTFRYIPNKSITPDMQIKFGTRTFEITSPPINFQEANIELQIMCKEVI